MLLNLRLQFVGSIIYFFCHSEHSEESIPAVMDSSLRSEWQGSTSGDACATYKGGIDSCHSEHSEESILAVMDSSLRSEWQGSTSRDACASTNKCKQDL